MSEDTTTIGENLVSPNGVSPNGVSPNGVSPNGVSPNGVSPNGVSPNGVSPNGVSPNGVSPNGATLNGVSPNGVSPNGTAIGIAATGTPLAGADLIGSTWTGQASTGASVLLRVDDAMQGTGSNTDVWSYKFSVSADGTWRPLCVDASGNEGFADSVSGTWNYAQGVAGGGSYTASSDMFTLACRGSAIAKCVEMGYKPWNSFVPELAACVRALRADYCGDGVSYTVNGTLINIFDIDGVQADTENWDPEAGWSPDGAVCVSKKKETRFNDVAHVKPTCYPSTLKPQKSCGTEFVDGIIVITEFLQP